MQHIPNERIIQTSNQYICYWKTSKRFTWTMPQLRGNHQVRCANKCLHIASNYEAGCEHELYNFIHCSSLVTDKLLRYWSHKRNLSRSLRNAFRSRMSLEPSMASEDNQQQTPEQKEKETHSSNSSCFSLTVTVIWHIVLKPVAMINLSKSEFYSNQKENPKSHFCIVFLYQTN